MEDKETDNITISEEVMEEIRKDLEINTYNLTETNRNAPNVTQKYLEVYFKQRRILKKIDLHMKKVEGELFQHYKTNFEIKLTSSSDIWVFVRKDPKWQKVANMFEQQEAVVDFFSNVIKNFQNRQFSISNEIKIKELEAKGM